MGEIKYMIGNFINGLNIMGEWDEQAKKLRKCVQIIFHKQNPMGRDVAIVVQTVFHPFTLQKKTVLEGLPEIEKFMRIDLDEKDLLCIRPVDEMQMSSELKNAYIEAWSRVITPEEKAEAEQARRAQEEMMRKQMEALKTGAGSEKPILQ